MTDKNLNIVLKVAATNLEALQKTGQELDATSAEAQALNKQATELQSTLDRLGAQKAAVDGFKALKKETDSAAKALGDAAGQVEQLGAKLPAVAAASQQLAAAERDAAKAVSEARTDLQAKQSALNALRVEYEGAARKTTEYKEAEAQLSAGIKAARNDLQAKQAALKAATAASTDAQNAERSLTAEYDKAVGSAAKLSTELGNRRTALEASRGAMKQLGLETTSLANTERQLAEAVKAAKTQVAELAPAYQRLAAQQRDMKVVGVESHAAIAKQVAETRAAFERLKASGQLTGAELAQASLKAELRIRELNAQTGNLVETLDRAKGAVVGLAAAGAGLTVVSNAAIDFESAMADVRKVVEGTDEEITELGSSLKQLSAEEIPITAEGLAKIAAAGGQIGVPIEKITEFTRLAATMAIAFDTSAEEAGAAVAKLGNNFDLPLEGVRKLGDAVNVLGNTTAAREKDIVDVLVRVGGTSKQFGLASEQAAALAATMLSLGTTSEVAATGINAMLAKLQTSAQGSKDFREALDSIGIDARKLAKDVRDHPQQAVLEFLATLEKLDKQSRAEMLVKLFGLEYQDDIARLVGSLGKYRENLAKVGDETRTAGAMQKEFAQRSATTANQLQLLQNSLNALAINIGDALLPVITPVVEGLTDITGAAAKFAEENPKFAALVTTLGTAITAVGGIRLALLAAQAAGSLAFGNLAQGAGGMLKPIGEAVGVVGKLNTAIGLLSAATAGYQLGKWAQDNFEEVRLYGVALVQAVFEMAEQVQHRWEQMRAVFSDDTLAEVEQRHQQRVTEMRRIFGELKDDATDAAVAQRKAAEDTAAAAEKSGKQIEQAAQSAATAVQGVGGAAQAASQQVAAAAPPAATAVAKVGQAFEGVAVSANAAARQGQQALTALTAGAPAAQVSLAELNLAATGLGVNLAQLGTKVGEGTKKAVADFGTLTGGLGTLRSEGVDTAAVVRQAIAGMVAKAETQADIDAIRDTLTGLADQQKITRDDYAVSLVLMRQRSEELREAIESSTPGLQGLRQAAKSAGVDFDELTTGVRKGFRDSVQGIDELIGELVASGIAAERASPLLEDALNKQVAAAKTKEEVELLRNALNKAEDAGFTFSEGLRKGMDKAAEAIEKARQKVAQTYEQIFNDQKRYERALTESKLYSPGVTNGVVGSLGGSQAARNATVNSSISSGYSPNGGTLGTFQIQPPSDDGNWVFDHEAFNRGILIGGPRGSRGMEVGPGAGQFNNFWRRTGPPPAVGEWGFAPTAAPAAAPALQPASEAQPAAANVLAAPTPAAPQAAPRVWPVRTVPTPPAPTPFEARQVDLLARLDALIDTLQNAPAGGRFQVMLPAANGGQSLVRVSSDEEVRALVAALQLAAGRA